VDDQAGMQAAACLHNAPPEVIADHLKRGHFFWLDLEGPTDERVQEPAENIGLHPLTVEDARTFSQRPKFDEYEGYVSWSYTASIGHELRRAAPARGCT
jgi:Mg2+ and Co2+ transporter CorA